MQCPLHARGQEALGSRTAITSMFVLVCQIHPVVQLKMMMTGMIGHVWQMCCTVSLND